MTLIAPSFLGWNSPKNPRRKSRGSPEVFGRNGALGWSGVESVRPPRPLRRRSFLSSVPGGLWHPSRRVLSSVLLLVLLTCDPRGERRGREAPHRPPQAEDEGWPQTGGGGREGKPPSKGPREALCPAAVVRGTGPFSASSEDLCLLVCTVHRPTMGLGGLRPPSTILRPPS